MTKSPSERYHVFLLLENVQVMVMDSPDIHVIIVLIHLGKRMGFDVRVSRNAVSKIREFQREATREMN